jgi:hypothetical protein
MLVLEDPIVSLIPNLSTYEHSEGSHGLAILTCGHHIRPLGESQVRPKVSVNLRDTQPIFGLHPKTTGEATLNKKVINRLHTLLA